MINKPDSIFDMDKEKARLYAHKLSKVYSKNAPFPHIVIDNFLPIEKIRILNKEFPKAALPSDVNYDAPLSTRKKRQIFPYECSETIINFFYDMNGANFLYFLEELTGIQGLIPDPYFHGGGLHETSSGGSLAVHSDFRVHKKLNVLRQLNVLIYLNDNWNDTFGGNLELWNKSCTEKIVSIAPIFNRCVIFTTDDTSFHGQPQPVTCPNGMTRRSIATYYYTASSRIHDEVKSTSADTFWHPGEGASAKDKILSLKNRIRLNLKEYVPPIIYRNIFK
jgi:hypothetical protein